MSVETARDVIAWAIIVVALVNLYFLISAYFTYRAVTPPSAILFALLGVGVVVWLVGMYIAVLAARSLVDLPTLPFGGLLAGIGILALMLLPAFIWWQVRKFTHATEEHHNERDIQRDLVRDAERDVERDTTRDVARDIGRDAPRDLERDTRVDDAP